MFIFAQKEIIRYSIQNRIMRLESSGNLMEGLHVSPVWSSSDNKHSKLEKLNSPKTPCHLEASSWEVSSRTEPQDKIGSPYPVMPGKQGLWVNSTVPSHLSRAFVQGQPIYLLTRGPEHDIRALWGGGDGLSKDVRLMA